MSEVLRVEDNMPTRRQRLVRTTSDTKSKAEKRILRQHSGAKVTNVEILPLSRDEKQIIHKSLH